MAERFSYYGSTVVFTNVIQQKLPWNCTGAGRLHGQSGALGLPQRASTGLTTFNSFWVYVVPLFGAYIADKKLGRFKTVCWSVGIAIVGHILLVISAVPPVWMTFDDQWVDELMRGFKAFVVFAWLPIYWLTYNQLNNNLTSQAATMNTHGLPNDILGSLDPLALIILIPICDLWLYPAPRRVGIRFTSIKKITLGFFTGSAAMIWAAVVQHYIYKTSPCGHLPRHVRRPAR